MNKNILLMLAFLLPLFSCAQNWAPINPDGIYNYQEATDNYITTSIRIDSFTVNGSDTVYHFNRIVKPCVGCSFALEDSVLLVNQEDFLSRSFVQQSDGLFVFNGQVNFQIDPYADLNDSWVFDSTNNVSATIINIEISSFFDQLDSCKTILLSTNDTLKLSKNFGLIDFNYQDKHYALTGLQNRNLGEIIPGWIDFHNFEIGDVFQYRTYNQSLSNFSYGIYKFTIVDKVETESQIIYTQDYIRSDTLQNGIFGFDYVYSQNIYTEGQNKNRLFDFSGNYNNQIAIMNGINGSSCTFNGNELFARPLRFSKNEITQAITLATGNFPQGLGNYHEQGYRYPIGSDTIFQDFCYDDFYEVYTTGLGRVYYSLEGLDNYIEGELIGYIKNGDTTGVITPDGVLLVGTENVSNSETTSFDIYPNPVQDRFAIYFRNEIPNDIQILNLDGQLVKDIRVADHLERIDVDLHGLAAGLYLVKARYDGFERIQKVVKR